MLNETKNNHGIFFGIDEMEFRQADIVFTVKPKDIKLSRKSILISILKFRLNFKLKMNFCI